jgi:hypothetical protein
MVVLDGGRDVPEDPVDERVVGRCIRVDDEERQRTDAWGSAQ